MKTSLEYVWRPDLIAKSVSFLMRQGVFFGEAMPLAEERTHRYGQKKQRRVIKKVAFAAQSLASKHTLTNNSHFISIEFPRIICAKFPNNYLGKGEDSDLLRVGSENLRSFRKLYCR